MGRVKEKMCLVYAPIAQLVERLAVNQCVLGSSPSGSASNKSHRQQ